MSTDNKLKRPVLNSDNINRNNTFFKKIVNSYANWNADNSVEMEEYENDIISCLTEYNTDGYALARHLYDTVFVEPDSELVHILDDVGYLVRNLNNELTKQWVIENSLTIPSDVIGKKVTYNLSYRKGQGFITTIMNDTYQVTVDENPDKKGGLIVNYENIQLEV
jgi:hypothetical protein